MKKVIYALVVVMIVAGLVIGCAAPAPAPAPTPTPTPTPTPAPAPTPPKPFEWPGMLVSVSGGGTSPGHLTALAWTPIQERDTGVTWRVIGAGPTAERLQWLREGKAQFYQSELISISNAIQVRKGYELRVHGQDRFRVALPGFPQFFGPAVWADRGIKTIYDIKPGATFSLPLTRGMGGILQDYYDGYRAWLNMSEEELIAVYTGSWQGSFRAYEEGRAVLVNSEPASPGVIEWMGSPHGCIFLDWPADDVEGEKRFHEVMPDMPFGVVNYGPKEFLGIRMSVNRWHGIALAEMDAEVVYHVLKWLDENYGHFKAQYLLCEYMTLEFLRETLDMTFIAVHEGTIRYLKEKGMWTAADDARQKYNVWLNDQYMEAYKSAIKMADEKRIEATPENKEWTELWKNYKKETGLPRIRLMTDEEIAAALAEYNIK